jgi:arylsulfatase A-like enzyme
MKKLLDCPEMKNDPCIDRRSFLKAAAGASVALPFLFSMASAASNKSGSGNRPNIILCMADDLGWGDVGFNGNPHIKTPNLDAMCQNGLRLDRFYAAAPLCSPTRASCLTGRNPWRIGIFAAHTNGMRQGEITIAKLAKSKKYTTGMFGKWHLGWVKPEEGGSRGYYSPPWQHDFEECFVTTSAVPTWNPTVTPEGWKSSEGNAGQPWKGGRPYVHNGVEVDDNMEGDDARVIMDRAIPFIQKAAADEKPFLACIWFHTVHEPVVAGPEYRKMYKDYDEEKQHYFGAITAMDEQIGRLRKELCRMKIENDTIVFFCSDNGPADGPTKKKIASAGPYKGHKHTMYEGGLRVPSLVEWPGRIKAGTVSNVMAGTVDYFPTISELLEIPDSYTKGRPIDGISLLAVMDGHAKERSKPMFFGYRRLFSGIDGQAIMIDNRYKLLHSAEPKGDYELYDILEDAAETHDLKNEKPELFKKMKEQLDQHVDSCIQSYLGRDYLI